MAKRFGKSPIKCDSEDDALLIQRRIEEFVNKKNLYCVTTMDSGSSYEQLGDHTLGPKQAGTIYNGCGCPTFTAVSSGYGDGVYDVEVKRQNGRIKEVRIKFF